MGQTRRVPLDLATGRGWRQRYQHRGANREFAHHSGLRRISRYGGYLNQPPAFVHFAKFDLPARGWAPELGPLGVVRRALRRSSQDASSRAVKTPLSCRYRSVPVRLNPCRQAEAELKAPEWVLVQRALHAPV